MSLPPAELSSKAISTLRRPVHLRPALRSRFLQRSSPKLFPCFTVHSPSGASTSRSVQQIPPSYFHGSPPVHLVRRFDLAPSSGALPKLFPRFTVQSTFVRRFDLALLAEPPPPRYFHASPSSPPLSGASVSLSPAELPPHYFHTSTSVHLLTFLSSFLSLPGSSGSSVPLSSRQSNLNENPKHRRCFWEKSNHELSSCLSWESLKVTMLNADGSREQTNFVQNPARRALRFTWNPSWMALIHQKSLGLIIQGFLGEKIKKFRPPREWISPIFGVIPMWLAK